MAEPTLERVIAIFTQETDLDGADITGKTRLRSFPDVDSLDFTEFFMLVEEEWGVTLPERVCCGFETFGDVVFEIERQRPSHG